jgi:SAM-dependent methyltransferase
MLIDKTIGYAWDSLQEIFGSNSEKMRIYRNCVNPYPNQKILDFGCATGLVAKRFEDLQYLGVDINPRSIRLALSKHPRTSNPNINFVCSDIFDLPLEKFDHILFAGTGHHIDDENLLSIISRLSHFLNDKGEIHFIDIIKTDSDSPQVRLMYSIDQGRYVRNIEQYQQLFSNLQSCTVSKPTIEVTNNKLFKYSFCYFKIISNSFNT